MATSCGAVATLGRLSRILLQRQLPSGACQQIRGAKQWHSSYYLAMYKRRQEVGPEPERHRAVWKNWNYDAEIFSFGKRLSENLSSATLKTVFTDRSYVAKETKERELAGVSNKLDMKDNDLLSRNGAALAAKYIDGYISTSLPLLPAEGQRAIRDYLLTDEVMSHVARNIGMTDLVLCEEFPVTAKTLSGALKALIGGLAEEQGEGRAGLFVRDFIVTQLVGKDVNELWEVVNPMGLLAKVLATAGRGEPEPRLLRQVGSRTVTAAYMVGVYSDKELIGEAAGETVTAAEELAARDALKRLFRTRDNRAPFCFPMQTSDSRAASVTA